MHEEQFHYVRMVSQGCSKQGSQIIGTFLAQRIGIRTSLEQHLRYLLVPSTSGLDQDSSFRSFSINIGAVVYQKICRLGLS
jgi:hypothetical protein